MNRVLPVHYLKIGVEVRIPDEDADEHDSVEETRADDCALLEVLPRQERNWSDFRFPEHEHREE